MMKSAQVEGRRVLEVLDELQGMGLLRYSLVPSGTDGLESRLEIWVDRSTLNRSAWGAGVSVKAVRLWDTLRAGSFRATLPLAAIQNVLNMLQDWEATNYGLDIRG